MIKSKESALMKIVSVFLCLLTAFNLTAFAVDSQPDAAVKSLSIINQSGVVKGETRQLQVVIESESSVFDGVTWSSSNPDVISCTKDGKITGLVAGEKARITCKSNWSSASDSITVYCVEAIPSEVESGFDFVLAFIYSNPGFGLKDICFDVVSIFGPASGALEFFSMFLSSITSSDVYLGSKVTVCGKIANYAYIRYGEANSQDGFVKYSRLKNTVSGFLNLSSTDMDVWGNGWANEDKKLTTTYKGEIEWTVSDESVISFNEETGQVTGLKPGTATITARCDGMSDSCKIYSLYRWPQTWSTKCNQNTYLYSAKSSNYITAKFMKSGTAFTVFGDNGTSDGWAYGNINGTNDWGYVPISHVSTKGTISQYNNLNWLWPVVTPSGKNKADYIYSPYGRRNRGTGMHKGIDITTGKSGEINGYEVIAAFTGTVNYVSRNENLFWGYCVAITSDESIKDPISGKQFVAIYMHLKNKPEFFVGQTVKAEKLIGYVGTTGDSDGYHLHFEVNNQTGSIYDIDGKEYSEAGRKSYNSLINPVFFYMDDGIRYNPESAAELYYNKTYWYGND